MSRLTFLFIVSIHVKHQMCRDEEKMIKACYWPNEQYEPCFGGCAEVSCDNPRNHLRPCYPYCEPGCVCEDPYVRDDRTHQCVLPQDCSPTQMGIPVPVKRSEKAPTSAYMSNSGRMARTHARHDDVGTDFAENDMSYNNVNPINSNYHQRDDSKRGSDVSRMGNYFNIVIAPPPIKALQPRKLVQNDPYRNDAKRMN